MTDKEYPLLDKIKSWGFDGAEIPIFSVDESQYRAIRRQLDAAGLGCTAVTVATPEANPISDDPKVRRAAVERLNGVLDMCAVCGAELLCGPYYSPVGRLVGRGRTQDEWKWCTDVFREVAEHADKVKVNLAVEYLNRFETYFLNCVEDTRSLVKAVAHPRLTMMYDTFHANIEEKAIYKSIRDSGDVLTHVHISENDRSTPGAGHVNWQDTFSALREIGYDRWLVIEAFGQALPDLAAATCIWRRMFPDEETLARRGLQFIRESYPAT